ncbi:F0F1 ATP synthase subunit B [Rubellicoccus peritrichatus]|uniref:ATP synthase subunit b n=1 Tax=Rubellicoccus peritrichatus TaxID=3080537 RepID=A0AAQ3LD64_9BACT|nr:F0F1 ATP synthase subunit B [Puniceicoccus sp. CR14]WOO42279.1 F0F1 ATP synthase subunit B [Puniceicoccus sp. CR14]
MLDLITIIAAGGVEGEVVGEANTLAGQFGVDWTFFIAQSINFVIVAAILWYFAFKPVIKTLEERKQKINDGLQFAEEMKVRLSDTEKQAAEKLRDASEEAANIVKEARENASSFVEKQTQEAVQQAEHIVAKAKEAMEQERKQMLAEIREEVAQLVVQTSAKVLDRELSADEKGRFSETAAKEIYANN